MAFTDLFKSKNKASNGKCPAHTRRPWGSPQHEYSKSVRNFLMGLLLLVVISVFVTAAVVVGLNHSKDCDGLQIQGWNGFQQNGCEGRQSSVSLVFTRTGWFLMCL